MTSQKMVHKVTKPGQRAALASTAPAELSAVPHSQDGVATRINNMRVTEQDVQLVMSDGELKTICVRRPAKGQIAIVDQVTVSFALSTLEAIGFDPLVSQDVQVSQLSQLLEDIFGFGITEELGRPSNFYNRTFLFGKFGQLCIGGQNDTALIYLYGLGALKAKYGWEQRLYDFLTFKAIRPKITRIDLAHDDFDGEAITVDWALETFRSGGFTWSGEAPEVETIGNWEKPKGKGRTLAVGLRRSGKYCRIYEKGRKEGCRESNWTRFEVELKGKDRVIPFDCLLDPSSYLAGTYPCAENLYHQADRIKTEKKTAAYNYKKMVEVCQVQMGRQLRFLKNFLDDSDAVLDLVMHPDPHAVPKRLVGITSGISTMPSFMHHLPTDRLLPEQIDFS